MEQEDFNVPNPHDQFFKITFREKTTVVNYMQKLMSPKLISQLDFNDMRLATTSHVSPVLREFFSDIIWEVGLKGSRKKLKLSFVFEHKSTRDDMVVIQLLRYMTEIWLAQLSQKPRVFTLAIATLVYHGEARWKPKSMRELFSDYPDFLLEYLPDFKFEWQSLSHIDDEVYMGIPDLTARYDLLVLATSKTDRLEDTVQKLLANDAETITAQDIEYLEKRLIPYIFAASKKQKKIINIFRSLPAPIKDTTMTVLQQLIEKGRKKGIAETASLLKKAEQEKQKAEQEKQKALHAAEQDRLKAEQAEQEKIKTIVNLIQKTQHSNAEIADITGTTEDYIQELRYKN